MSNPSPYNMGYLAAHRAGTYSVFGEVRAMPWCPCDVGSPADKAWNVAWLEGISDSIEDRRQRRFDPSRRPAVAII